jgi:ATP-dependent Clp protease ATP-binding subunit ClpC
MQRSNADSTVKAEAPPPEEAVQILKGLRPKYETHHKAKLTDRRWKQPFTFRSIYYWPFPAG